MSALKEAPLAEPQEADIQSALAKLAAVAGQYDTQKQGSLAALTETTK
jgi:hypothetical protein